MRSYSEAFVDSTPLTFETACPLGSDGKPNYQAADCLKFITDRKNEFVSEQQTRKDNTMANALNTFQRVSDADRNSAIGMIRTQDMIGLQNAVASHTTGLKSTYDYDLGVSKRQFEINEYNYYNKLDTLFFLQLFFIAVLVMAIIVYFNRRGTITTQMTGILTALLAIMLIVTGVSRYFYTIRTRDRRLWHRRYFATEKDPGPALLSTCPGPSSADATATINLNAIFDASSIDCALETKKSFTDWRDAANAEVQNQLQKGTLPGSVFASGPSSFRVSEKCRKR